MRPRLLVAVLVVLVMLLAACASPGPTAAPSSTDARVSPSPSTAAPSPSWSPTALPTPASSPSPTDPPNPSATMVAFEATYPRADWALAAAVDASGDQEIHTAYGSVAEGALIEFALTCSDRSQVTVIASDGAGQTVYGFAAPCSPDQVGIVSGPLTEAAMTLDLQAAALDPAVRFWVKLGVPKDAFTP